MCKKLDFVLNTRSATISRTASSLSTSTSSQNRNTFLSKSNSYFLQRERPLITIYAPMIYTAPCIMFWMYKS